MSLTAYPLSLRSVIVTRALEPSPPLRQDCDEIARRSTGAGCAGPIPSEIAGLKEGPLARPTVGLMEAGRADVAAARCTASAGACSRIWSTSSHPAAATIMASGNQPKAVLR